ncbi:hypothetical protein H8B02_20665 [Bradyrhizobium sp. Pear77]|nr:hypothetical protein [Bradyrhizobium altum]MCC8955758.1 hypothetical protein [Bradyrhizobium altum]
MAEVFADFLLAMIMARPVHANAEHDPESAKQLSEKTMLKQKAKAR